MPLTSRSLLSIAIALLAIVCGFGQRVQGQDVQVIDVNTGLSVLQPSGTVNIGSYSPGADHANVLSFVFPQDVTIQQITFDPAAGGVQELSRAGIAGCELGIATRSCKIAIVQDPAYAGQRSGTIRFVTTEKTYAVPVSFTSTRSQTVITPGTVSSIPLRTGSHGATSVAVDAVGNLYATETADMVVEKIDAVGSTHTVIAGNGGTGNSGDGGPATAAETGTPFAVNVSPAGDLYFVSNGSTGTVEAVRKVAAYTGTISTVATIPSKGTYGSNVVDANGNIFVSVPSQRYLYERLPSGNVIPLTGLYVGSQAPPIYPLCPQLNSYRYRADALALGNGYLYFSSEAAVYRVNPIFSQCPVVEKVAGLGVVGNNGDGGLAINAAMGTITGLAVDPAGDIYLADETNGVVRMVNGSSGVISTIAGPGSALPNITVGGLFASLALDAAGNLYVLSADGMAIQKIDRNTVSLSFATTAVGALSTDSPKSLALLNIGINPFAFSTDSGPTAPTFSSTDFSFDPSSTCPQTANASAAPLGPAESCSVGVRFAPKQAGDLTGTLTITGQEKTDRPILSRITKVVSLTGEATAPQAMTTVTLSPANIDFGTVTQGESSGTWSINVANTGTSTLNVAGLALSDTKNFALGGDCSAPVAPYSSCNISVTFKPQEAGTLRATLVLTDNAQPTSQTVTLKGTSLSNAPVLSISPTSIDFGSITVSSTSPVWTVNVANKGGSPLKLTSVNKTTPYFILGGNCSGYIAAYSSCNVTVAFTPQFVGTAADMIQIIGPDLNDPKYVRVSGVGVEAALPVVELSPSTIDFGTVSTGKASGTWTVWVGNRGPVPLNLSSIVLSDTKNFVLGSNCGAMVAAYSSCLATVAFKPQSAGTFNSTLTFSDNAKPGIQNVQLTGKAVSPKYSISVTPGSLSLKAGQTGSATFSFVPEGGYTGTVSFSCAGLPANASCSFVPASLTADGTDKVQAAQLTVATKGINTALATKGNSGGGVTLAGAVSCNLLLLGWLGLRRKKATGLHGVCLLALLLLIGLAGITGCGAGILGGSTPVGSAAVKVMAVSATDGSSQTASFTLTITE